MSVQNLSDSLGTASFNTGVTVTSGFRAVAGIQAPTFSGSSDFVPWILYTLGLGPKY